MPERSLGISPLPRTISVADILDPAVYAAGRGQYRQASLNHKRARRLALGPHATVYFESYQTIWMQIHEMLHIERGCQAQVGHELATYGPLVPNGRELVATIMFEIEDLARRQGLLRQLGGVEHCFSLQIGLESVVGHPETDVERTTAQGQASSVHFVHFPLTPAQITAFRTPHTRIMVGITHPAYGHLAFLPDAMRSILAADLD